MGSFIFFDTKLRIFRSNLKEHIRSRGSCDICIHRENIFEEAFQALNSKSLPEFLSPIHVNYINEAGSDAGGLARDFYSAITQQMFSPSFGLFDVHPQSGVRPTSKPADKPLLDRLRFAGKMVAKAITEYQTLNVVLSPVLLKQILGHPLTFADLQQTDNELYQSLNQILTNPLEDETYFELTVPSSSPDQPPTTHELKPNGSETAVTEASKAEFVMLYALHALNPFNFEQTSAFVDGFLSVIPRSLLTLFDSHDLDLLISGTPTLNIHEIKHAVRYSGYTISSPQIKQLWYLVDHFTPDLQSKFLRFFTGLSRLPSGGIKNLTDNRGNKATLQISSSSNPRRLPEAHTCSFHLVLPSYPDYRTLRKKLLQAMKDSGDFGML